MTQVHRSYPPPRCRRSLPRIRYLSRIGCFSRIRLCSSLLLSIALLSALPGICASPSLTAPSPDAVHIDAKHAIFHISDQSEVHADRVTGWMFPVSKQPVSLDDPRSFRLRIDGGESSITAADLTRLFNQQVLPTAITSIRHVECTFEDGKVVFHGTARRLVDVGFIAEATVHAGHDGHLLIHPTSVRGASWFSNHLMHAMNMNQSSMLKPGPRAQYRMIGEDLDLPLSALFPPPVVEGHLVSVRIVGDRLVQNFGPTDDLATPPTPASAYIYFRGGTMRFGKLTMKDVDLELVDKDNAPQVTFSIASYYHQLEAGYSKALPNRGLLVYMGGAKTIGATH